MISLINEYIGKKEKTKSKDRNWNHIKIFAAISKHISRYNTNQTSILFFENNFSAHSCNFIVTINFTVICVHPFRLLSTLTTMYRKNGLYISRISRNMIAINSKRCQNLENNWQLNFNARLKQEIFFQSRNLTRNNFFGLFSTFLFRDSR